MEQYTERHIASKRPTKKEIYYEGSEKRHLIFWVDLVVVESARSDGKKFLLPVIYVQKRRTLLVPWRSPEACNTRTREWNEQLCVWKAAAGSRAGGD